MDLPALKVMPGLPGVTAASGGAVAPGVTAISGAAVAVETLLLGTREGRLTYRVARQDLLGDEHPDAAARRLAGFTGDEGAKGRMLHSTSWRFAEGQIVLTYAALPDPHPGTAAFLRRPAEAVGGADLLAPSPPQVEQADVVAHACRHLAFLSHTDPEIAAAGRRQPDLWELLDAYRPGVAGRLPG